LLGDAVDFGHGDALRELWRWIGECARLSSEQVIIASNFRWLTRRAMSRNLEGPFGSHEATWIGSIMRYVLALALAAGLTSPVLAGKYNEVLNIGDTAPAWKDLEGTDGKKHSLADLQDKDVVVVVFISNSCDVATDYEDRILAFSKKYAGAEGKVGLVAINVNKIAEDLMPAMRERAEAKGFDFPYLIDETQQIGRDYGANFTPEFFVLDKDRKVAYMGGMDDSSLAGMVKTKFLEPAVEAVLAEKSPETAEAPAIGCRIRYERQRRKR
jgi:peroxiredoxin